jgi:hypothetical protein
MLLDIIQAHEQHSSQATHIQTPLSLLCTLYRSTVTPQHPDFAQITALSIPNIPQYLAPTLTAQ